MQWQASALLLATHPFGESRAIARVFTRDKGVCAGLINRGRSKILPQPGTTVAASWQGRLEEQLGRFTLESIKPAPMHSPLIVASATSLLVQLLPEQNPYPQLYNATAALLEAPTLAHYAAWECGLLAELGYGLDLAACAATGTLDDLCYISPKTGRAVSRAAGKAYADKLLPMPVFYQNNQADPETALKTSQYFLEKWLIHPPKTLPMARHMLV